MADEQIDFKSLLAQEDPLPVGTVDFKALLDEFGTGTLGGPTAELRQPIEVRSGQISQFTGRELPASRAQEATARGFDVEDPGGTVPQRLAGRFGDIQDVKNALAAGTEFSPDDFEVANFEGIGLHFKGPTDDRFRLLDPAGFDPGDIVVEGLELLPAAAEIGTAAVTKNPLALATAAATTRAGILKVLKGLGVVEDPNIITEALIEGGLSFGGAVAPPIKRFFDPERRAVESIAKQAEIEQFRAGAEQVGEIATDVEKITGARPQFTVGEELGAVEPEFAQVIVGAETGARADILPARSQRQASEALKQRFERGAVPGEEAAIDITARQAQRTEAAIVRAEDLAEQQTARINADLEKVTGTTQPAEIRATLAKGVEDVRTSISRSYDSIRADAAEANIDLTGVGEVANEIIEKARVFPNANTVFKEALEASTKPGGGLNTYQAAQEARSELRAHIRALKTDKSAGAQIREAQALEQEFTKAINTALNDIDPALAERLIDTDLAFKSSKEKLEQGVVGKLISTREGVAVVPDEALVKTILGNTSDTQRFLNSAEEFFPEVDAKAQLKDAFYAGYRDKVLTGKVTHNSYMNQIKDTGELIFSPDELRVLKNAGTAKNRVLQIEKKLKARIKKIEKTFNFKVGNKIEPHKLVDNVSKSPQKTAQLKRILTDDEWAEYQGARRAKAIKDMTNSKGQLTLDGVTKVLDGPKGELKLSMGADYIKDLETTRKFLRVLATKAAGVSEAKKKVISGLDVTRALIYGPLSHEGFVLNIVKGFGRARTAKALTKLLNNPELLKRRVEIFKMPRTKQLEQLQNLWGGIGLPLAVNRGTDIEETE